MYPIRDTRMWLTLPQSYHGSASETQWPQSSKWKISMRGWSAGDRIYFDGFHYCTVDAASLFKCNSMGSTVATRESKKCQPVWSTATSNGASDLTAKSLYTVWLMWAGYTVQFPCEVQTLADFGCKPRSSAQGFWHSPHSLRKRPADNPRKYVIYATAFINQPSQLSRQDKDQVLREQGHQVLSHF